VELDCLRERRPANHEGGLVAARLVALYIREIRPVNENS
jgi:hypothetical protein